MKRSDVNRLMFRVIASLLLLCGIATNASAQDVEREGQYRMGIDMGWKLAKGLKFNVAPQFRFGDGFSLDQFQVEAGLSYKTFGFLYWGVDYRLAVVPTAENINPEVNSKYGFSATLKQDFKRFTPSLRVMYTNYSDEDIDDKAFMKYRAKVEYNIRKSKFTPYVAVEAYQGMDEHLLAKMRYSTGFDFKVKKGRYLCVDYKFYFYTLKYKNRNVFDIGYKFRF